MADRPIIFSAPMVRALLDGRKTQTRRVLKPQPVAAVTGFQKVFLNPPYFEATSNGKPFSAAFPEGLHSMTPYPSVRYAIGDRLWVREAHSIWADAESAAAAQCLEGADEPCIYRADYLDGTESEPMGGSGWRPSIHMPRWASRITLTVTDVRVQRLQEISEEDAKAEGIVPASRRFPPFQGCPNQLRERTIYEWSGGWSVRAADAYAALWNSIHGPGAWAANPWVAAYTFTVHRCNIDQMEADHG